MKTITLTAGILLGFSLCIAGSNAFATGRDSSTTGTVTLAKIPTVSISEPINAAPFLWGLFGSKDSWFGSVCLNVFSFKMAMVAQVSGSIPVSADYTISQKYEIIKGGKQVVYYAEIIDAQRTSRQIVERTVPIEGVVQLLDSCVVSFATIIAGSLEEPIMRSLSMNVCGNHLSLIKTFGNLAAKPDRAKSADYIKLIDSDSRLLLAYHAALKACAREGDFAHAADFCKGLLNLFPHNPALYAEACRTYRIAGNYQMSLYYAVQAEKQKIMTSAVLLEKGLVYRALKRNALAFETFEKLLSRTPSDTTALLFCAQYHNGHGRYDAAGIYAKRLLSQIPHHGAASLEWAKSLIARGKTNEATAPLLDAVKADPQEPQGHLMLGDLYTEREEYVSAAGHYRKAIPAMGDNIEATIKAAQAFEMAGDLGSAHSLLKRFDIQTLVHLSLIQKKLGFIEIQLGDTVNAQKHFLNSLQSDQSDDRVFLLLGDINRHSNQPDAALRMYERALLIAQNPQSVRLCIAKLLVKKNNAAEAIGVLNRILVESDTIAGVNQCMGDAVLMQGDTAHALRYYLKERAVAGGNNRGDARIASIYFNRHDWQKADVEYRKLVTSQPGVVAFGLYHGITLLRLKQADQARKVLAGIALDSTISSDILYELGNGWLYNDVKDAALAAYSVCVRSAPLYGAGWLALAAVREAVSMDSAAAEAYYTLFQLDEKKNGIYGIRAGHLFNTLKLYANAKQVYTALVEAGIQDLNVAVNLAMIEFAAGNFNRTITLLSPWNTGNQLSEKTTIILAESFYNTANFDQALLVARSVLLKNKQCDGAVLLAAQAADKAELPREALTYFEQLCALKTPLQTAAHAYRCAELYETLGQNEKSLTQYLANIRRYSSEPGNYRRGAALLMDRKEWSRARELLDKALRLPDFDGAILKMAAQTCRAQNNIGGALKYYHRYLEKHAADSAAWYEVGSLLYAQQRYGAAVAALEKAASRMPWFGDVQYLLGYCYSRTGRVAEAVVSLSRAYALNPGDRRIISSLVDCYTIQSNTDKLIPLLEQWSKVESGNSAIYAELASYLLETGNLKHAAIVIETALRLAPTDLSVLKVAAQASRLRGEQEHNFAFLSAALTLAPQDVAVNYELGCYYRNKGLRDVGEVYLQKALEGDPAHAATRLAYAQLLIARNDFSAARYQLDQLLEQQPDNRDGLIERAWLAVKAGQPDTALQYVRRVLQRDSSSTMLEFAGSVFLALNNRDSAFVYYRLSISRDQTKTCNSCFIALGKLLIDVNDYAMAQKCFEHALRIDPLNSESIMRMGTLFVLTGKYDRALQYLAKASTLRDVPEECGYWLAHTYLMLGQPQQAAETCRRAALHGESPWLRIAEGEIRMHEGRLDLAAVSFSVATTMLPENLWALAGKGRLELLRHNADSAAHYLVLAAAQLPKDQLLRLDLARAYDQSGRIDSARSIYTSLLDYVPCQLAAYQALGAIAENKGNYTDAVAITQQAIVRYPRNEELQITLGNQLIALKQYPEAIEAMNRAVRLNRSLSAGLYRVIADLYYDKLGDQKSARRYYEQYLKTGVSDQKVKELLAKL